MLGTARRQVNLWEAQLPDNMPRLEAQSYIRINSELQAVDLFPSHPEKCAGCDKLVAEVAGLQVKPGDTWKTMEKTRAWREARFVFQPEVKVPKTGGSTLKPAISVWFCGICMTNAPVMRQALRKRHGHRFAVGKVDYPALVAAIVSQHDSYAELSAEMPGIETRIGRLHPRIDPACAASLQPHVDTYRMRQEARSASKAKVASDETTDTEDAPAIESPELTEKE